MAWVTLPFEFRTANTFRFQMQTVCLKVKHVARVIFGIQFDNGYKVICLLVSVRDSIVGSWMCNFSIENATYNVNFVKLRIVDV